MYSTRSAKVKEGSLPAIKMLSRRLRNGGPGSHSDVVRATIGDGVHNRVSRVNDIQLL
jgi:hypothetical protein